MKLRKRYHIRRNKIIRRGYSEISSGYKQECATHKKTGIQAEGSGQKEPEEALATVRACHPAHIVFYHF
jgi:hypothetical protein